jgi:hypothetical protein
VFQYFHITLTDDSDQYQGKNEVPATTRNLQQDNGNIQVFREFVQEATFSTRQQVADVVIEYIDATKRHGVQYPTTMPLLAYPSFWIWT